MNCHSLSLPCYSKLNPGSPIINKLPLLAYLMCSTALTRLGMALSTRRMLVNNPLVRGAMINSGTCIGFWVALRRLHFGVALV